MVDLMDGGPGLMELDPPTWERMQENMLESDELEAPVDLDALLDPSVMDEVDGGAAAPDTASTTGPETER